MTGEPGAPNLLRGVAFGEGLGDCGPTVRLNERVQVLEVPPVTEPADIFVGPVVDWEVSGAWRLCVGRSDPRTAGQWGQERRSKGLGELGPRLPDPSQDWYAPMSRS